MADKLLSIPLNLQTKGNRKIISFGLFIKIISFGLFILQSVPFACYVAGQSDVFELKSDLDLASFRVTHFRKIYSCQQIGIDMH